MSLTTEFEGIDPKKVDARIDALRQGIEAQLSPIVQELQQTRALERATVSWYSDNTADTVHSAANDGKTVTKQSIEEDISTPSQDTSDGAEFAARVKKLMETRPGFSLGAFFKRQVRNQKITFLDDLKEKGEALLADARKAVEQAQTSLGQTRDEQYTNFEAVQVFYDDLTQAITAQDTDALVALIESKTAKIIPAEQRRNLLLKPVNYHDTAMLAIADLEFFDSKQEAQTVATIANGFGDDLAGLQIIQQTANSLEDERKRKSYQSYAMAFTGTFIPAGNQIVNFNHVGHVDYNTEHGRIQFYGMARGSTYEIMDQAAAHAILDQLAERPNFVVAGDQVVNLNQVGHADYDANNGRIRFRGMARGSTYETMDQAAAQVILDQLAERPNFVVAGDQVVNLNQVGHADYDANNGRIRFHGMASGSTYETMDQAAAQVILNQLAERPNFVVAGDQVVNLNQVGHADYNAERSRIQFYGMASGSTYETMDQAAAQVILNQLAERPNFVVAGDQVVNLNQVGHADYNAERGRIQFYGMARGSTYETMDEATAQAILDQLVERPNFVVAGDQVVNLNQVGHADYNAERGRIQFYGMARGSTYETMDQKEAQAILDQLAERPNFVVAGHQVVNLNQVGHADYNAERGRVQFYGMASGSTYETMDQAEAQDLLKKIRQVGQRMTVLGTYGANRDQLLYGLHEARAWENDYRSTHQDSDTLMDYLPLIIVGAIILFDDHGQPDMHDLDVTDDQAGLDGLGMDNEFTDASGLGDMDTALDNDFSVDSFEADFADMDTGMDGGIDNDFDAGGGIDMGGGLDTSSDFGGFGLD